MKAAWTLGVVSPKSGKSVSLVQLSDGVGLPLRNRIAQEIATSTGMQVRIEGGPVKNQRNPRTVMDCAAGIPVARLLAMSARDAGCVAQAIATATGRRVATIHGNPPPVPATGQVWKGPGGVRARIVTVGDLRVQVVQLDSGNREWLDRKEFLATWKPPGATVKPNPSRSLAARIGRSRRRLERSRKQRRAGARKRSGKSGAAQLKHEIARHDVRRILQTGSSRARAYRSPQPPGYGERGRGGNPRGGPRVVYNRLLGGWYVVTGPHQAPLNGRFNSKAEAVAWLAGRGRAERPARNPKGAVVSIFGGKYTLEDMGEHVGKNTGRIRLFMATGRRGAQYGAMVYEDGRFHWVNAARPGRTNVPFDLAQVSPLGFFEIPNPRGADSARARKVAEMWHEAKPTSARRMKAPERVPAELAGLGALRSVVYESDKYAGSPDNPKGKQQLYKHSFKKPYPWLASDGESLFVVGGKVKVTADGLVN